jgi:hypothetical protein
MREKQSKTKGRFEGVFCGQSPSVCHHDARSFASSEKFGDRVVFRKQSVPGPPHFNLEKSMDTMVTDMRHSLHICAHSFGVYGAKFPGLEMGFRYLDGFTLMAYTTIGAQA